MLDPVHSSRHIFGGLSGLVVCVNYDDFLRITIPFNRRHFNHLFVLTSENDPRTIKYCQESGVDYLTTEAWTENGAYFNKGKGINVGLTKLRQLKSEWVCILDADIILPPNFLRSTPSLDANCLYSCRRRLCPEQSDYDPHKSWASYELEPLPATVEVEGRLCVWGNSRLRATDAAGLFGYLQMWNLGRFNARYPTQFQSAHSYDVRFASLWPEENRHWLSDEVLHLGPAKTNWHGRLTERWD